MKLNWYNIICVCVFICCICISLRSCRDEYELNKKLKNNKLEVIEELKQQNKDLTNSINKLEIIKEYEIEKARNANDSVTLELWKQLLAD